MGLCGVYAQQMNRQRFRGRREYHLSEISSLTIFVPYDCRFQGLFRWEEEEEEYNGLYCRFSNCRIRYILDNRLPLLEVFSATPKTPGKR